MSDNGNQHWAMMPVSDNRGRIADDHALLLRFVNSGSQDAFAELVGRHFRLVRSRCRQVLGDEHLADDAAQRVFLTLALKAATLKAEVRIRGWLFQTARHTAADLRKQEMRRRRRHEVAAQMALERNVGVPRREERLRQTVAEIIAHLPETDRDALYHRYIAGMTYAEMGQAMGLTREGAKKRFARALRRTRARFSGREWFPSLLAPILLLLRRGKCVGSGARAAVVPVMSIWQRLTFRMATFAAIVAVAAIVVGEKPPTARPSIESHSLLASAIRFASPKRVQTAIHKHPSHVISTESDDADSTVWVAMEEFSSHRDLTASSAPKYEDPWIGLSQFKRAQAVNSQGRLASSVVATSKIACANDSDLTPNPAVGSPWNIAAAYSPGKAVDLEVHNGPAVRAIASAPAMYFIPPEISAAGQTPALQQILTSLQTATQAGPLADTTPDGDIRSGPTQGVFFEQIVQVIMSTGVNAATGNTLNKIQVAHPSSGSLTPGEAQTEFADVMQVNVISASSLEFAPDISFSEASVSLSPWPEDAVPTGLATSVPEPAATTGLFLFAGYLLRRRKRSED
jgi:RNA polymerase sigma factor (sigma-70 family)